MALPKRGFTLPSLCRTLHNLETVAVGVAKNIASGTLKVKREKPLTTKLMEAAFKTKFVKDQVFSKAKGQVMKQTNGLYPAPLKVGYYFFLKCSCLKL